VNHHQSLQTWLELHRASLVASVNATLLVSNGLQLWHVVRFDFKKPPPDSSVPEDAHNI